MKDPIIFKKIEIDFTLYTLYNQVSHLKLTMSFPIESDDRNDSQFDVHPDEHNEPQTKRSKLRSKSPERKIPKGKNREIQNTANTEYVKFCTAIGIEPQPYFTRRTSAAKLCGSKAYREKAKKMGRVNSDRRAMLLDNSDDLFCERIYIASKLNCEPVRKIRRGPVTDRPCASEVIAFNWPSRTDRWKYPTTFAEAALSWGW